MMGNKGSNVKELIQEERIVLNTKIHEMNRRLLKNAFGEFFEQASLLTLVIDEMGVIIQANASWAAKLGWEKHELVNCRFLDLLDPADISTAQKMIAMVSVHHKRAEGFKTRFRKKNGGYLPLVWNLFSSMDHRFNFGIARVSGPFGVD